MTGATTWALIRRAVVFELRLWRSLARWILRRPRTTGPHAEGFSYASAVTPVFSAFIVLSAIEIPAVHLMLPWETARLVLLFAGVQGLLWMIGLLASIRVHPHVVSDDGLRIRYGSSLDIAVPWHDIATVRTRTRSLEKNRTLQFSPTGTGLALQVVVLSQTNVEVLLRQPTVIALPKCDSDPVTELHCYADRPGDLVARSRAYCQL